MSDTLLIGRDGAVDRFRGMLTGASHENVYRVVGPEKMGKSRLMREFKRIAEDEYRAHCAMVNLRPQLQGHSHADVMQTICQQIGTAYCHNYRTARDAGTQAGAVEVSKVVQLFSWMNIRKDNEADAIDNQRRRLTEALILDFQALPPHLAKVILFDTFDQAGDALKVWVYDDLLVGLYRVPNMFVVMAGRDLPDPSPAWQDRTCVQALAPVTTEDYRKYTDSLGIEMSEESLSLFHKGLQGNPGMFTEIAHKLAVGV